jgi:hypothetical protein
MAIPKIQHALNGWKTNITLIRLSQSINDDGILEDVETPISFKGVVQPLTAKSLKVKPEGKRSWQSWQIHTDIDVGISTGDKVNYLGKIYEVEAYLDYSLNNYYEYHLLKDYE